jgi:hypothetical protein
VLAVPLPASGTVVVTLQLPPGHHITPGAPSRFQPVPAAAHAPIRWAGPSTATLLHAADDGAENISHVTWRMPWVAAGGAGDPAAARLEVDLALYYCSDADGLCMAETATLILVPDPSPSPAATTTEVSVTWAYVV